MGETVDDASKPKPTTILVPPRASVELLFASGSGPGFSPGPMTLVSNMFPEHSPFSFSQLLAGAMASPLAAQPVGDSGNGAKEGNLSDAMKNSDFGIGGKWNRPTNLVVTAPQVQIESLTSLFMVHPGLSPSGFLNSPSFLSPLQSPFGMSHQQALAHVTAQAALSPSFMQMQAEIQHSASKEAAEALANCSTSAPSDTLTRQTNTLPPGPESSKKESSEVSQSDKKAVPVSGDKPVSDGYNWRKYGQKHVKASECPRSYYKCTHLNCPVKKKVEQLLDGRISEITYKGQHNHDPPLNNKRGKDNYAVDRTVNSQVKPVITAQDQAERNRLSEARPVLTMSTNFKEANQQPSVNLPVTSQNDDRRDTAIVVVDDLDDEEPNAKRRSRDIGPTIPASTHQTVSESKIVLQTRSEVDLLDDGYRWRKYGQKVVKGNPHPRSYYRCTYAGCNVRKHVERASADPKAVITTYEGKHTHDIPIGRHSSHQSTVSALKSKKMETENPSVNEEVDYGNQDQMAMTLQLKEERITA